MGLFGELGGRQLLSDGKDASLCYYLLTEY